MVLFGRFESMSFSLSRSVFCLSYFQALPKHRNELIHALLELVEPTRLEKGCLLYELVIDNEDPNLLIMAEKFTSAEALDRHEKEPHILAFVEGPMTDWCEKVSWHVGPQVNHDRQ